MLDFAVRLTHSPSQVRRSDLERLRRHGFDDAAIHDIVQVVALFAYYNRLADGLGIEPEPEWSDTESGRRRREGVPRARSRSG